MAHSLRLSYREQLRVEERKEGRENPGLTTSRAGRGRVFPHSLEQLKTEIHGVVFCADVSTVTTLTGFGLYYYYIIYLVILGIIYSLPSMNLFPKLTLVM